jgi:hypothetical protein
MLLHLVLLRNPRDSVLPKSRVAQRAARLLQVKINSVVIQADATAKHLRLRDFDGALLERRRRERGAASLHRSALYARSSLSRIQSQWGRRPRSEPMLLGLAKQGIPLASPASIMGLLHVLPSLRKILWPHIVILRHQG